MVGQGFRPAAGLLPGVSGFHHSWYLFVLPVQEINS
jgi:hypothetical protein